MSAIAGYWSFDGAEGASDLCARMLKAQQIYGPHASATWNDGPVAVGRGLYRLLPEDRFDRQPLIGADGRLVLVADIRLDNRDELAAALGLSAERRDSLCDAALLLAAFERWDEACLDRVLGDFAFAVWDATKRRLLLARDALGQRPLHYHRDRRGFAFASMPKGLHALPGVAREPDEERIAEFLVVLPEFGSKSYFKNIERVESGHVVIVEPDRIVARRYWDPPVKPIRFKRPDDYAEAMREQVDAATQARLRSASGAIGAHLSAGLDSSIVAGTAARLLAPSGRRLVAFTGAPYGDFTGGSSALRIADESVHAAATAAMHDNIDHVVVRADTSPLKNLDRYFFLFDRPVLDPCNGVWVDAIADIARQRRLDVLLMGAMGNLTLSFNGIMFLPDYLRRGRLLSWSRQALGLWRSGAMSARGIIGNSFGPFVPPAVWARVSGREPPTPERVADHAAINPDRFRELRLDALARERQFEMASRPRQNAFETRLWALRRVDVGNVNKGTLAGWGYDQRDPTADRRLIEFCLNLPPEQYLSRGVMRVGARQAFRDRVPPMVLEERRRGQQGADWHKRMSAVRDQLAEEVVRLGECGPAQRAIDLPRLRRLLEDWPQDGWDKDEVVLNYRIVLQRAVATGHFLRRATGQNL